MASDPIKQAAELKQRSNRISGLRDVLNEATDVLSDDMVESLIFQVEDVRNKQQAAEAAAKLQFGGYPLGKVGDEVWQQLWDAARNFSAEVYDEQPFPVTEDAVCVLCQQSLDANAQDRMKRFEQFVSDKTASVAQTAKQALQVRVKNIERLRFREPQFKELLIDLKHSNPDLGQILRTEWSVVLRRYRAICRAAESGQWNDLQLPPLVELTCVTDFVTSLKNQAEDLVANADVAGRAKLRHELRELQDRQWLATVSTDVKKHMLRLISIEQYSECIKETKTNSITSQSKLLAKEYVTDRLRVAFAGEIRRMHQGVKRIEVELVPSKGEFGTTTYHVQLIGAKGEKVAHVASKGEHRCIALAAFLSELATESSKSAIIFDDPVTSLDHNWRQCLANRLVEEAGVRQVIVFTHDIAFLHDLLDGARLTGLEPHIRRLSSMRDKSGIVSDTLPWRGQRLRHRIDQMEQQSRSLRRSYGNSMRTATRKMLVVSTVICDRLLSEQLKRGSFVASYCVIVTTFLLQIFTRLLL